MKKSNVKCSASAVLRLNPALDREIQEVLPEAPPPWAPGYLRESWDLRRSPSKAFPWASSICILAIPYAAMPPVELPRAAGADTAGLISGYAARMDYHRFAPPMPSEGRCEVVIDTRPLAEKTLAALAGIGSLGRNNCLLLPGADAGNFLVFILTEEALPEQRHPRADHCLDCDGCGDMAEPQFCISTLTMEKRGELTPEEQNLLNGRIFGCSACTAACPGTRLPPDFELDLEWLLMSPSKAVERAIRETPMNYAGVTLLRRNALYVLNNRNTPRSRELLRRFRETTGSAFLRAVAGPF